MIQCHVSTLQLASYTCPRRYLNCLSPFDPAVHGKISHLRILIARSRLYHKGYKKGRRFLNHAERYEELCHCCLISTTQASRQKAEEGLEQRG